MEGKQIVIRMARSPDAAHIRHGLHLRQDSNGDCRTYIRAGPKAQGSSQREQLQPEVIGIREEDIGKPQG